MKEDIAMGESEISLMQIISYSGEARSLCFEALQNCRDDDEEVGRKQYKNAEEDLYAAKQARSRIPKQSTNGELDQISLLVVHVEGQMMANEVIYQMTKELFHYVSEAKG